MGTLVGTILLITLPIGVVIWWLTLFIARSAARLEVRQFSSLFQAQAHGQIKLQTKYHSPLDPSTPIPTYHPIFYRLKPTSAPSIPHHERGHFGPDPSNEADEGYVWDKRFLKCSYAMVSP